MAQGVLAGAPAWARERFSVALAPKIEDVAGEVLVWALEGDRTSAVISEQFKSNAEEYHRRYPASDHFEHLFRQAIAATGLAVPARPLILDVGSGSGVNSVVPCQRLFPGARQVATDLSGELLAMLGAYQRDERRDDVVCVEMDAMGEQVVPGGFDLVTGASILHHLDNPEQGLAAAARALKPGGHAIFFEPFIGWAVVRLAFERILAESRTRLRGRLEPVVKSALEQLVRDVHERSRAERDRATFAALDDKWLFSRTRIENAAQALGFSGVAFVPHNDHASLYRDVSAIHLRLATGRDDYQLPDWALAILDTYDEAMPLQAKRELMLEATIVLTKGPA